MKGCVAHAGADWEAVADTLGTRRWNHKSCPCSWCSTDLDSMYDFSVESAMLTHQDWLDAKSATQISVRLTPALATLVQKHLEPDLRKDGARGLALNANIGTQPTICSKFDQ